MSKNDQSSEQSSHAESIKGAVLQALANQWSVYGIGGKLHQCLQVLIRDLARAGGYEATIEFGLETPRRGFVDVAIFGDNVKIAVEVPVSTKYHEAVNLRKCLDAGFDYVVSVALERKVLDVVRRGAGRAIDASVVTQRVRFMFPEELAHFLKDLGKGNREQPDLTLPVVHGYRVRVKRWSLSEAEIKHRMDEIAKVVAGAIHRKRQAVQMGS